MERSLTSGRGVTHLKRTLSISAKQYVSLPRRRSRVRMPSPASKPASIGWSFISEPLTTSLAPRAYSFSVEFIGEGLGRIEKRLRRRANVS